MRISRRQFLTRGGLATAGLAITGKPAAAGYNSPELRTKGLKTTTTICPFCAVGCGMVVSVKDGKIVNIEGDDLHPINRGSLCSKGEAVFQVANNERRLQKVMYRGPGEDHWEEKSWDWALDRIARLMNALRDSPVAFLILSILRISSCGRLMATFLVSVMVILLSSII